MACLQTCCLVNRVVDCASKECRSSNADQQARESSVVNPLMLLLSVQKGNCLNPLSLGLPP